MKKFRSIIFLVLLLLVVLAFTVPSERDFENHIKEELQDSTGEGFLGINNLVNGVITEAIKLTSNYTDIKVGSTYKFSLEEDNEFLYVGFGTMIFRVKGEFNSVHD